MDRVKGRRNRDRLRRASSQAGHGYATEAVRAVLEELRDMGFRRVTAGYFEGNEASHRVMEKCGMQPVAYTDEEEYRGVRHLCRYCEVRF